MKVLDFQGPQDIGKQCRTLSNRIHMILETPGNLMTSKFSSKARNFDQNLNL